MSLHFSSISNKEDNGKNLTDVEEVSSEEEEEHDVKSDRGDNGDSPRLILLQQEALASPMVARAAENPSTSSLAMLILMGSFVCSVKFKRRSTKAAKMYRWLVLALTFKNWKRSFSRLLQSR